MKDVMPGNLNKEDVDNLLYLYCSGNKVDELKKLLENYRDIIDVTDDNGLYLSVPMAKGQYELLDTLLQHYENNQLKADSGTTAYKAAKHKLQVVLDSLLEEITVQDEAILRRVSPYTGSNEVESIRDDLSDLEDTLSDSEYTGKTEETNFSSSPDSIGSFELKYNDIQMNKNFLPIAEEDSTKKSVDQWMAGMAQEQIALPPVWSSPPPQAQIAVHSPISRHTDENPIGNGTVLYEKMRTESTYDKVRIEKEIALRLKSEGVDVEKAVVIHPNYLFNEDTAELFIKDLVSKIKSSATITKTGEITSPVLLIPMNINNEHWVAMTAEFADAKVKVTYMDSERAAMPESLSNGLKAALVREYPNTDVEVAEKVVELQQSNDCGLHAIKNLVAAVASQADIGKEHTPAAHTVQGAWKISTGIEKLLGGMEKALNAFMHSDPNDSLSVVHFVFFAIGCAVLGKIYSSELGHMVTDVVDSAGDLLLGVHGLENTTSLS